MSTAQLVLWGVRDFEHFIISHEQTQYNRVCIFYSFILIRLLLMDRLFTRILNWRSLFFSSTSRHGSKCESGNNKLLATGQCNVQCILDRMRQEPVIWNKFNHWKEYFSEMTLREISIVFYIYKTICINGV